MDSAAEQSLQATVSHQPAPATGANTHLIGVLFCFVLSGFAALLYQTAWLRQFSIVFGTSELAVATVLAAYMAGLALGAYAGGKLVGRVTRPVLTYGLLELGIALGALLVPVGLNLARGLQAALIGGQDELVSAGGMAQPLFYLAAAFVVIMIPTTFMGATLPLLTRHAVREDSQIGSRVGMLYTMNTAGAVVGTLVAAFVLLPSLGLAGTVYVGVLVNGLVFLIAAAIAKTSQPSAQGAPSATEPESTPADAIVAATEERGDSRASWILPLILISGVTSFTYEVLWTRLLGQILGGSVFAFATMLATFLVGITIGSAIASAFARTRKSSALGFVAAQIGIAVLSMMAWNQIDGLPEQFLKLNRGGEGGFTAGALLAAMVLLPSAICIGATFPFALRILARKSDDAGRASARVYSWNTVGAIVGAVLAGFFLIPGLGFERSAQFAIGTNLVLAFLTALAFLSSNKPVVALSAVSLIGIFMFKPESPENLMRHSFMGLPAEGEILYQAVGHSATVLGIEQNGTFEVRSSGLPEASVAPRGAVPFGINAPYYLALLPVIARPKAESMMVIGFGGGVTLEAVAPSIKQLDVIELEPEIIRANEVFAPRRRVNPFRDKRLNLIYNDARGALALTDEKWDIIVSQPSHPWTAGASHLYTREFLELSKQHLNKDGVFVQWMSAGFLDSELFGSIGNTLMSSFEHVRLYRPISNMLIFLASDSPLNVEVDVANTGQPMAAHRAWWSWLGLYDVTDVAALLAVDQQGLEALCGDAPVCTDDANLLAMRAKPSNSEFQGNGLDQFLFPHDPILNLGSDLSRDLASYLDRAYLATKLAYSDLLLRGIQSSNILEPGSAFKLRVQGSLKASLIEGRWADGIKDFESSYRLDPNDTETVFLVLRDRMPMVAMGSHGSENLKPLLPQLSGVSKEVYKGWEYFFSKRFKDLQALEPILAKAVPSDPWFVDCSRLRAAWRLAVATPEEAPKAGWAALQVIDRALVCEPNPFLLVQRADASVMAIRPAFLLESLDNLVEFVGPRSAVLSANVVNTLAQELGKHRPRLALIQKDRPGLARRCEEVAARIDLVLREHSNRLASTPGNNAAVPNSGDR
ncbi:MAG: spermidine synthase [Candidatus Paceibacteria bacterium]|jgi:spermidine synthase